MSKEGWDSFKAEVGEWKDMIVALFVMMGLSTFVVLAIATPVIFIVVAVLFILHRIT